MRLRCARLGGRQSPASSHPSPAPIEAHPGFLGHDLELVSQTIAIRPVLYENHRIVLPRARGDRETVAVRMGAPDDVPILRHPLTPSGPQAHPSPTGRVGVVRVS